MTARDSTDAQALRFTLADAVATETLGESLGRALAAHIPVKDRASPLMITLCGSLGAGKTTLVRGVMRALGHLGTVKSPTYTLVEPYDVDGVAVYHFDLYRLRDPDELEFIGARDYFSQTGICLVEWADRARDALPPPDVELTLEFIETGRELTLRAGSNVGVRLTENLHISDKLLAITDRLD